MPLYNGRERRDFESLDYDERVELPPANQPESLDMPSSPEPQTSKPEFTGPERRKIRPEEVWESANPEERRLITGVLLARRGRQEIPWLNEKSSS